MSDSTALSRQRPSSHQVAAARAFAHFIRVFAGSPLASRLKNEALPGLLPRMQMQRPFALPLAFAAMLALGATSACAQGVYGPYPRSTVRIDDRAYRNGYDEGRNQGERDARNGRSFDYRRTREYNTATRGYGGYGNRNEYRDVFRQGFVAGYDDGYRRSARRSPQYPPSGPRVYGDRDGGGIFRSPAATQGYEDGVNEGRKDGRDGNRFDPQRESRYRSGDHGYEREYGSRDAYKRDYRVAFEDGYDRGYREVRR
jgi:hypothetical protein